MKLERALLGSLGRSSNQEDCFCKVQEQQGKKKRGKVEKWHKLHFGSNCTRLWVGNVLMAGTGLVVPLGVCRGRR